MQASSKERLIAGQLETDSQYSLWPSHSLQNFPRCTGLFPNAHSIHAYPCSDADVSLQRLQLAFLAVGALPCARQVCSTRSAMNTMPWHCRARIQT